MANSGGVRRASMMALSHTQPRLDVRRRHGRRHEIVGLGNQCAKSQQKMPAIDRTSVRQYIVASLLFVCINFGYLKKFSLGVSLLSLNEAG